MRQILCDCCKKVIENTKGFTPIRISFKHTDPSGMFELDYCENCKTELKKKLGI